MKRSILLILIVLLISRGRLFAQLDKDFDLQRFVEKRINDQEVGSSFEELYERLLLAYEHPIDINQIDRQGLINLGLLSSIQIQALLNYRTANGKLNTPYELLYITGFNLEHVNALLPFITLSPKASGHKPLLNRIFTERNNYFILRHERVLESKRGYSNKNIPNQVGYFGSPDKLYLRYRVSKPGDFSFGFTTEKDAGESLKWDSSKRSYGMDFWSGHAMLQKHGKWKKIIIGDYQLQLGQGLTFGSGFSTGKGSETINTLERASIGITPYTSVVEGGFMRGLATSYTLNPKLFSTLFVSSLNQDANVTQSSVNNENSFSSIQLTGLHRTPRELANKHQINEKIYGIELAYHPDQQSKFGLVGAFSRYSLPLQRNSQAYNLFEFSGKRNFNLSIYGNTYLQGINFFGEIAISKSGGMGGLIGFTTHLIERIQFGFIVRNYHQDFHSIRGSAFGENSQNINETGIYWGIKYKLNRKFNLAAYYDSFGFHWLKFRVDKPSEGNDFLLRFNYNPNSTTSAFLQIRGKNKDENVSLDDDSKVVATGRKLQYLINARYQVTTTLSFQTRIQWSRFTISGKLTNGYAIIQDLNYKLSDLSMSIRHAIFDTKGQQNRQYAYERDILYAFSIPGYSGQGIRNYLLLDYRISSQVSVWARIARTTFYDRNEIGTGLETIDGNKRTAIKFQIRYKIR